jgi:hypothetical protein
MLIHLIGFGKIAFGKTQVINGVKKVCFSNSIIATDANDSFRKGKGSLFIIFELDGRYILYAKQMTDLGCNLADAFLSGWIMLLFLL